jgi:hypothetical protein
MTPHQTGWLLLDTWDERIREALDFGFSGCETLGARELRELPRCPVCKRRVWGSAIGRADAFKFTEKRIGDVSNESPETLVVTDRFRSKWTEAGLKGIEFSNAELQCRFPARSTTPSKSFVLAYPQAVFTDFADLNTVERAIEPACSFCASSEVRRAVEPRFASVEIGQLDCFLPSCMPGWVVVSTRAFETVRAERLLNFSVMMGFAWSETRELERIEYELQLPDGKYQRHERFIPTVSGS